MDKVFDYITTHNAVSVMLRRQSSQLYIWRACYRASIDTITTMAEYFDFVYLKDGYTVDEHFKFIARKLGTTPHEAAAALNVVSTQKVAYVSKDLNRTLAFKDPGVVRAVSVDEEILADHQAEVRHPIKHENGTNIWYVVFCDAERADHYLKLGIEGWGYSVFEAELEERMVYAILEDQMVHSIEQKVKGDDEVVEF